MAEESQSLSDLSELGEATGAVPAEPEDSNEPKLDAQGRAYATGKRKNAVARVWIKPGSGRVSVNGRDVETYFARYNKDPNSKDWRDWPYLTGDAAVEAPDGYIRILGRIDDVINVSGHRLGTKEIESAALVVEEVAEAAVVPVAHEIKGKEPDLYIALKPGFQASDELAKKISDAISSEIGKIAKPRHVCLLCCGCFCGHSHQCHDAAGLPTCQSQSSRQPDLRPCSLLSSNPYAIMMA